MTDDPRIKVTRDLTEIARLAAALREQAINDADNPDIPGGEALIALAHVGNHEAWENLNDSAERTGIPYTNPDLEDPDNQWTPLQTLTYWTESWRAAHGMDYVHNPTLQSETNFIRWALDWAVENEPLWRAFAADVAKARVRLENILRDGTRHERGVPCMYDECRGVRIIRKLTPGRDEHGNKVWNLTNWHCPRCKRSWDNDAYARMVTAAAEAAKFEDIDGELWCSIDYAARQLERPAKTIETWTRRGHVATACMIIGRRLRFIRLDDARNQAARMKGRKIAAD